MIGHHHVIDQKSHCCIVETGTVTRANGNALNEQILNYNPNVMLGKADMGLNKFGNEMNGVTTVMMELLTSSVVDEATFAIGFDNMLVLLFLRRCAGATGGREVGAVRNRRGKFWDENVFGYNVRYLDTLLMTGKHTHFTKT